MDSHTRGQPRVSEWYAGRTILVTGGTGFMGKVLLEKLLRSCPDLERILVLVRPKRGTDSRSRIKQMLQLPLFDKLRKENPKVLEKLSAIEGDITKPDLGLSDADKMLLQEKTSVLFNCAASVRMDQSLKDAVQSNVVSTLRLLELAEGMKRLEVFLHLSTTFCHCEEKEVGEVVYPPPAAPRSVIDLVSWMKDKDLEAITPSLLGNHPNTYTYTKLLAEDLVREKGAKINAVIARPSIVIPTWRDPMPGWVDSIYGPVGIAIAAGKGVLRSMMVGENCNAEVMPVDIAINCMIGIAWTVGSQKPRGLPVYNVTQGELFPITWGQILNTGRKMFLENPFENVVWYPDGNITSNKLVHWLCIIFLHFLPAYIVDFILLLFGQKTMLVRIQKRISLGLSLMQYFTMRQWVFLNDNICRLESSMCEADRQVFYTRVEKEFDVELYIRDFFWGARCYAMREDPSTLPRARSHVTMMYYVSRTFNLLMYSLFAWLFYHLLLWTLTTVSPEALVGSKTWSLINTRF